jgi:hypothetical protein
MFDRIRRLLSHPKADTWVLAVATLLVSTSIPAGLAADDFVHELVIGGKSPIRGFRHAPLDLFRFASPESNPSLIQDGVFGWWVDPSARFAFFRPLAALTHWVDHVLWPESPALMHVQSVLWHLLGLLAARALYRTVFGPGWTAAFALALYALDDRRGAPVAWIANRNEVVAFALSLWALVWFDRSRAGGSRRAAFVAPALLGLGLLASEGAIAVTAYLFAYVLCLEEGPLARRLLRLLPYAAIVALWAAVYRGLGYGVSGSGVYFDPLGAPVRFLRALPERFSMLWLSQLGGPWSEGWNAYSVLLPGAERVVAVLAVVVLAGAAYLFTPVLRRDRTARFFLVGGVLSTLPACAAFPADRLLPWVGVGGMGLTACFFCAYADGVLEATGAYAVAARLGAFAVLGAHLVVGPILLPNRAAGIAAVRASIERADSGVPHGPDVTSKVVIYLNPPADPFVSYIPITRAALGQPMPRLQRWLVTGAKPVHVERLDERSLRVRQDGGLLVLPSETLFRDVEKHPFTVGQVIELEEMQLTMTEVTPDGRPLEFIARFARPLEDPTYVWLAWGRGRYVPYTPPPLGNGTTVPAADFIQVAYGPDSAVARAFGRK